MHKEQTSGRCPLEMISRYRGALMGFAALWILAYHCWIPVLSGYGILGRIESAAKNTGFAGVDIFLFLSGMGLTYAIRKEGLKQFYAKRLRRVVFPFMVIAVLRGIVEGWTLARFLRDASGVFLFVNTYEFLWFVPAIVVLYLLFPAYHRALERAGHDGLVTAAAIALWLAASLLLKDAFCRGFYGFTNRIPVFLLGILAGRTGQRRRLSFSAVHLLICLAMLVAGCALYALTMRGVTILVPASDCALPTLLIAVSLCALLAALFARLEADRGFVGRCGRAGIRLLAFFGGFSLELYCVQEWVDQMVYAALEGKAAYPVINAVSLLLIFAASYGLYALHRQVWRFADAREKRR